MGTRAGNGGLFAAAAIFSSAILAALTRPSDAGAWVWFLILWLILFAVSLLTFDSKADNRRITSFIKRRDNAIVYTAATSGLLKHLARMMAPATVQKEPCPEAGFIRKFAWYLEPRAVDTADLNRLRASPWSWPVMDVALKLAVVYPLFLLLAQWTVTGDDTGVGGATVIPGSDVVRARYALFCPLALLLITSALASATRLRVFEKAAGWLYLAAVAAAVAVALSCWRNRGRTGYVILALGAYTVMVLTLTQVAGTNTTNRNIAFALGLLPLLNAVFDYLSYGITLTLIKYGAAQRNAWSFIVAAVDAMLAFVLLVLLGCAVVFTVALINAMSSEPLLDIGSVFADLRDPAARSAYTRLYLSLFSTLIPTGVHLIIGIFSITTWLPMSAKSWLADRMIASPETGNLGSIFGLLATTLIGAVWCFAIVLLLWEGGSWVVSNIEAICLAVLSCVETITIALGLL